MLPSKGRKLKIQTSLSEVKPFSGIYSPSSSPRSSPRNRMSTETWKAEAVTYRRMLLPLPLVSSEQVVAYSRDGTVCEERLKDQSSSHVVDSVQKHDFQTRPARRESDTSAIEESFDIEGFPHAIGHVAMAVARFKAILLRCQVLADLRKCKRRRKRIKRCATTIG